MRWCIAGKRLCFMSIIDSLPGVSKMQPRDRSNRLLGNILARGGALQERQ
jgi:hypothetical protein